MEITVKALTTCDVAPDGGAISLGFEDTTGKPAAVQVSLNQVGALIMTLPGLLERALKARYGDQACVTPIRWPRGCWSGRPTPASASSRWRPRTVSR